MIDIEKMIMDAFEQFPEKATKYFAQNLEPVIKVITQEAISNFYDSYTPEKYDRTNNFRYGTEAFVTSHGTTINIDLLSDMQDYPSWNGSKSFSETDAWDNMFIEGNHGYGRWLMATTKSPLDYINETISTHPLAVSALTDAAEKALQEIKL